MSMPEQGDRLREQQLALTRYLRDPDHQPAPEGIEQRRLSVYRNLLFNNIEGLLAGNFPVIRRLLGDAAWRELVRAFYGDHRCRTPLFPEIAREFLRFLQDRPHTEPAFLIEMAHYEWVELALQISEATTARMAQDDDALGAIPSPSLPDTSLLDFLLTVSPLAWPLAYRWPVHRIGPDYQPDMPPPTPTLLLLRREPDGSVRFSNLSPLAFRLLQQIGEDTPAISGRAHLQALARESSANDVAGFIEQGHTLLRQMHATGVIVVEPSSQEDEHAADSG